MDELIKILDKNLTYLNHEILEDTIYIKVTSSRESFVCPSCKKESTKIHSHYTKTFQDLPIQDKKVIIILDNRKFFCENKECSNITFSETFDCIEFKSKKSKRLIKYIVNTSMKLSTIDASKMLKKIGVNVSKSTIHSLLKKIEDEIDYENPIIVCIDDFAFKKRHTYGTILINLETRKIIDILNSCDVEEVTAWLKKFPNIKIFNRDGSYNYARAISQAHPEAQQISDYFHLVKNLSEYLKDYLLKKLPKVLTVENKTLPKLNIEILKKKELYSSEWEFAKAIKELHSSGKNFSEIGKIFNLQYRSVKKYIEIKEEECLNKELTQSKQKKKQKLVERVKELYRSGKTYKYIGEILDLDYKTIKKYIEVSTPLVHRTIERTSSIIPYKNEVIQLLNKRVSKKEIYNIFKEKGYKQAMRTFYNSVSKIVKEYYDISDISQENINSLRIKVSKITKLLYYPLEKIEGLDENIYKQIIKKYSWIADILNIMKNFKIAVKEKI